MAGGEDRGPSHLDVLAVSVAACVHYAAAVLHGRGLSTEWEKERAPSPRLGRLSMKVRLPPGLTEGLLATVERAIESCPAYKTLLHPPAVELAIEVAGATRRDELSA